jgi:hypothetical protein
MNRLFTYVVNWKNNPHASFAIYGAALAEVLKIWLPHYAEQLAGTQKVLTWYGILAASNTGQPTQPGTAYNEPVNGKGNGLTKTLPLLILVVLASFIFSGCTSCIRAASDGKVAVTVTEKVFGIVIKQSSQNETPTIQLGFVTSVVKLTPCNTNGPIYIASTADTFAIGNSVVPFSFDVTETDATGVYQTGNANSTNSVTSQPIIPK